ncbi:hypothetical protein B0I37DRAFT_440374 [Chaetomium sp. MPI-CAGE-AT-0009]|nr:hypothetical protein B0I37DRAFT_440374 [Chaetomium sp. MPI-CAGE-AT-0009]
MVNQSDVMDLRDKRFIFTLMERARLFGLALGKSAPAVEACLRELATELRTNIGVILFHARDSEGRNAVNYATISHNTEVINYLVSQRPTFSPALRSKTHRGESTILYAIRQRCPPSIVDRIIRGAGQDILKMPTAEGLGAVHYAAVFDAPELVTFLVQKHKLDPTQAFKRIEEAGVPPYLFPEPVDGDTPLHLAARHNSATAFEALHAKLGLEMHWPFNSAGESPIDVAARVNAEEVITYIRLLRIPKMVGVSRRDQARRMRLKRRIEDVN